MTIGGLPCPEHGTGPSTGGLLMVGVILSVIADAIISVSLNLQKHAHNRNWDHAAGKPKRPFTRLPLWWVGMLLNVFGELGNLVAYAAATRLPGFARLLLPSFGRCCCCWLSTPALPPW